MATISEMIKHEGMKFVLYTKDGSKVLGKFDSEKEAKKREQEIMAAMAAKAKMGEGLALDIASGKLVLAEGARLTLAEMDMGEMADGDLQAMRALMLDKYNEELKAFQALGEDRYSTPEGNAAMMNMNYYRGCLSRCECEMQCRMITLD